MEITPKTETIIKLICILILIILCISIYIHGKELSCNKCQVSIQQNNQVFKVNISEIYNLYLEDKCIGFSYGIK